jgi:hypothetical protein
MLSHTYNNSIHRVAAHVSVMHNNGICMVSYMMINLFFLKHCIMPAVYCCHFQISVVQHSLYACDSSGETGRKVFALGAGTKGAPKWIPKYPIARARQGVGHAKI